MNALRLALAALLAFAMGCSVGTKGSNFAPAQEPAGVQMEIKVRGRSLSVKAELLAVQDTALIAVWTQGANKPQLVMIPLSTISSARATTVSGGSYVDDYKYTSPERRERIRLLARYPQGISPALMQLLLGDYGQKEIGRL